MNKREWTLFDTVDDGADLIDPKSEDAKAGMKDQIAIAHLEAAFYLLKRRFPDAKGPSNVAGFQELFGADLCTLLSGIWENLMKTEFSGAESRREGITGRSLLW